MYFNSFTFFIFFIVVIGLNFSLPHKWQNRMLLLASYIFYSWWDWRFLSLILISTILDYYCGLKVHKKPKVYAKKQFIYLSVICNLTLLGFFKYYNFFVDSMAQFLTQIGFNPNLPILSVILPVGISFYTFQTMTYSIDVYRGKLKPTTDFLDFALFVSFFPQLVAGPIERASRLLPQIQNKRSVKMCSFLDGLQLIYWGLFKKVFVADNLGPVVDSIYGAPSATGWEYIIATWAFAWQIFCDFSGYTDIARGVAKCLGFNLQLNFLQPYFVTNPSTFWRHWHISLSSWLRDYLYIPLGGNRGSKWNVYRNLMITMLLGGLWHGAGWTFLLWGAYHGVLLCIFRVFHLSSKNGNSSQTPLDVYLIKCFFMFQVICISWIFFRAADLTQVILIFKQLLLIDSQCIFDFQAFETLLKVLFFCSIPLISMGNRTLKMRRLKNTNIETVYTQASILSEQPMLVRSGVLGLMTYLLCFYGAKAESFIYFQF
jgi:D-alanyl-lipoteichoic acid acyltransferase DltB (MBOAT superfamily)